MGLIWALFSVGLVSAAQLLLRGAMVELPPLSDLFAFLNHLFHLRAGTIGLRATQSELYSGLGRRYLAARLA